MKSNKQMLEETTFMTTTVSAEEVLKEKLQLYQIYSERILKMKKEKLELDNILKTQEIPDESILESKSILSKNLIKENNEIKILKKDIANLVGNSKNLFSDLHKISNLVSQDFAMEINTIITNNKELSKKLKSALSKEISGVYKLDPENISIEEKEEGKQNGFIIKDDKTGLKLFTKESKVFGNDINSIDPRELFAYKILEHMDLGPEVNFIITAGSSSFSGAKICNIVTKDAGFSENKEVQSIFMTDNFISEKQPCEEEIYHWKKSLNSQEFRAKFIALSIVNDLLHLNDSFAINALNYGSLLQELKCNAMLVDHEVKNSIFKYENDKNPIISLIDKLKTNANNNLNKYGELISFKMIKENKIFLSKEDLANELKIAIHFVSKSFNKAFELAKEDIKIIMSKFKESFSEKASDALNDYILQTETNTKLFFEVQDSYLGDIEETIKVVAGLLYGDEIQFKGDFSDTYDGLYLEDIEYNIQIVNNLIQDKRAFDKVISINKLYSNLTQGQHLYLINPEGYESNFNTDLLKYKNNNISVFNANVEKDNSTCADHSLILLTKILQLGIPLSQVGIAGIENAYGKHASLYIISDNKVDLSIKISEVIDNYKNEEKIVDTIEYFDTLLADNGQLSDNLDHYHYSADVIGNNIEYTQLALSI